MKRYISLEEISDGKLYDDNDMVKACSGGCEGCSACCQGMGDSIVLDPFDVYRLTVGLGKSLEALLAKEVALGVVDGMILPYLKMSGEKEACAFLNAQGRCSIHVHRPGICRLFPLGRFYENGSYRYFLQTKECAKQNLTKVKVSKWIGVENVRENRAFVTAWHYFLEACQEMLAEEKDETFQRNLTLYVLRLFFMRPYDGEREFYQQFKERLSRAEEDLGLKTADGADR